MQNQQEQMPVEETANMHLMLAAIAQQKGNSTDFVSHSCLHLLRRGGGLPTCEDGPVSTFLTRAPQ